MTSQQRKGDRRERELVNKLYDDNFGVTRIPSSGSATKRELPDIVAGNGDVYMAIEAKSSGGDPIYIPEEEVADLTEFATRFGAKPRIAARFDREDWYFFNPENLYRTNAGTYRIKQEDLPDGQDYHEATGQSTQTTF